MGRKPIRTKPEVRLRRKEERRRRKKINNMTGKNTVFHSKHPSLPGILTNLLRTPLYTDLIFFRTWERHSPSSGYFSEETTEGGKVSPYCMFTPNYPPHPLSMESDAELVWDDDERDWIYKPPMEDEAADKMIQEYLDTHTME